jgi:hypothetical protein
MLRMDYEQILSLSISNQFSSSTLLPNNLSLLENATLAEVYFISLRSSEANYQLNQDHF